MKENYVENGKEASRAIGKFFVNFLSVKKIKALDFS